MCVCMYVCVSVYMKPLGTLDALNSEVLVLLRRCP